MVSTSRVMAIANTPSLNVSRRALPTATAYGRRNTHPRRGPAQVEARVVPGRHMLRFVNRTRAADPGAGAGAVAVDPTSSVGQRPGQRLRATVLRHQRSLLMYGPLAMVVVLTFATTSDDPFITLRYASNLVHGRGLVFNPGERVEGFSSPLHVLIAALVVLVPGGRTLLVAKLVALLFAVLAVRETSKLVDASGLPRWASNVALLLASGSWVIALAAANALETTLVCWLVTLLIVRLVTAGAYQTTYTTGVVAAACVLARPEALLVVCALAAVALVIDRAEPLWRRLGWFAIALCVAAGAELARLAYYGATLPNTYYAKELTQTSAL